MNTTGKAPGAEQLRDSIHRQMGAGRFGQACDTLRALIELSPGDIPARLELAHTLARTGQWKDSRQPLLEAMRYLPRHVPVVMALLRELLLRGEVVAVRQCLDFLQQAPEPPVDLLKSLAGLRSLLGEHEAARRLIERALAAGADDPDILHAHAMALNATGLPDAAESEWNRLVERWPGYVDALVFLVDLRRQQSPRWLEHAETRLRALDPDRHDAGAQYLRAGFDYVRFKVLDDLDRRDEAWEALCRCNRQMHKLVRYDAGQERGLVDALIRHSPVTAGTATDTPHAGGPTPVFIVGMPRSGTTLLERMLSSHSRIGTAGEIVDFERQLRMLTNVGPEEAGSLQSAVEHSDRIDFAELGSGYLKQTGWHANGRPFYIDKLPFNIRMVGFIRRALPHARILHMVRDPMDTCFSNFRRMFGLGAPYSYDMQALAHFYRQYTRLVEHWHRQMPGAMMDVPYAQLVRDPEGEMRRVLAYCGLEFEPACLCPERNAVPVVTPSSAQVREPIHQRGIGGWRRYEHQLAPLRDFLGVAG